MHLMISLCPGCHAKVHRTQVVFSAMPSLLLVLWREQHPKGHEQKMLDFIGKRPLHLPVPFFPEDQRINRGIGLWMHFLIAYLFKRVFLRNSSDICVVTNIRE